MQNRCLICKYLHTNISESLSRSTFYNNNENRQIVLCQLHSIEFFKLGQYRFLANYLSLFQHGMFQLDEDTWVLEYIGSRSSHYPQAV